MRFNTTFTAIVLSICCAGAFAQAATAPAATPGVDQRQQNQEQRIDQGQASGQLTARESRRLDRQQARINRAETVAKADGTVTRGERRHLHAMQDHAGKSIYRQKHDAQTRSGTRPAMPPSGPGTGTNASPGG